MDFDEYEYLEKAVENPESQQSKEVVNGGEESRKSGGKDRRQSSRRRDEEDGHMDHKSKRSRSGDDPRDREWHREKGSSRHRSRSKEVERNEKDGERHRSSREHKDKVREREERNGRDRERDRNGDREREQRRERDHDRGRVRKEHEHEKEIDKGSDEYDNRSMSHSIKHQEDGERIRNKEHMEMSQGKEFEERIQGRELREKESRRYKEKKDDAAEPEVDPERDQRTVFAYQLPLRADERDIFEFFSRAGKVRDVRLIMDRNSRRSKGVGYIEFYDAMSVPMAIALSGQPIRGHPVMVKPSEAEKNLVQSTAATSGAGGLTGSGAARRLYVGNLVPNITEEQLRVVFESFGTIELVQLPRDETGLCKGFAFVQFARLEDAKAAQNLNGQLDIGGRLIKVSVVTDQPGMQEAGASTGDLDDDEGGGLALNASSRAILMQKLDRSGAASSIAGLLASSAVNGSSMAHALVPNAAPGVSSMVAPLTQASISSLGGMHATGSVPSMNIPTIDTVGAPSECLQLKNMFDPKLETEPDFELDIKDDVHDECAKFGTLKHIFVDKNSDGFVFLRFDNTQAAMNAQRALHGRWFAGKMISAIYMLPQNYEAKFPESR